MSNEGNYSAFPVMPPLDAGSSAGGYPCPEMGLTKREYFAALAMQGCCANSIPGSQHTFENTASEAVAYADALLAELAKPSR